ncbi:septum formation initiator family protein [Enterococcus sp. BWB1-3]|uniref:FtsB family cell division protein n=1 Tax=unclassified Enterococcus TaxID=2608891 RepID=UPI001924E100|nr:MULTISPECIES: septum formation initiator family protein [unclassified Enterococcus]MBL1230677.1 septum formation initiator family protein [Enterococcus sp. BWB1-3]MCB5952902.1 septum formation initiator family protein [Enterococcus sp. BWT-B8]MCB5953590.1 septum formation initiator family protein [Enterococcus sp. CWB-B31]
MGRNKKESNNIAALNNEYTKEQYAEFQKQQKKLIFKRRRLAVIFFIAIVVFSISGIELLKDYQKLHSFEKQKEEVVAESSEVDKKLRRLEEDVALLKDPNYVAKLARSRYYMYKEGEQIYHVPDFGSAISTDKETTTATTTTESSQTQSQSSDE